MSFIASFYLVEAAQADKLTSLAEYVPPAKKLFGLIPRKVVDTKSNFWKFISDEIRELEEYEYSGFGFVELIMMYPDYAAASESVLGVRISKAMDSAYLSFTKAEAQQAIAMLGPDCPTDAEIARHFREHGRASEASDWVVPVQVAWSTTKEWLVQVGDTQIGLLSVG